MDQHDLKRYHAAAERLDRAVRKNEPTNIVVVEVRQVYGNDTVYPVNAAGKQFAAIAGQRTLTRAVIGRIKGLGYKVVVQGPQVYADSIGAIPAVTGAQP